MAARCWLLALAFWSCSILALHGGYDFGFDVEEHLNKRQVGWPIITTGVSGRNIQVRQEIRQLERDSDLWTLYLLGLDALQNGNQSSPISWYGLTGIHGVPFKPWQGVQPVSGGEASGYCTHSSVLFPTWHRPYLALYEQVLFDRIRAIAARWPTSMGGDRYRAAAPRFRIPYWDWAARPASGGTFPMSLQRPTVVLNTPTGKRTMANPLYSYTFRPLIPSELLRQPFTLWTSTVRAPTTNDGRAQSNNAFVAGMLDASANNLASRLYNLLTVASDYRSFSTHVSDPRNGTVRDSIESIHDIVHALAGGSGWNGGHMSYIPFSGFDPMFFLHHAMVDRIFAIWQVLHPNSWVPPMPAGTASYTTPRGAIQRSTTPLTPFFASMNGTFWTSDMVRNHTIFGYTYSEIPRPRNPTAISRLKLTVNRLYGASSPANSFQGTLRMARDLSVSERNYDQGYGHGLNSGYSHSHSHNTDDNRHHHHSKGHDTSREITASDRYRVKSQVFNNRNEYREWMANVHVEKQALREPFTIHVFLGDVPCDPKTWTTAKNLIGSVGVFNTGDAYAMPMGGLQISGTVPLTSRFIEKVVSGELQSLEPKHVRPFLQKNLNTAVVGASGKVYPLADIPTLGLDVSSTVVKAADSEYEFPQWGRTETLNLTVGESEDGDGECA